MNMWLIRNGANKALVRMQTPLRFVCTAQLGRYMQHMYE